MKNKKNYYKLSNKEKIKLFEKLIDGVLFKAIKDTYGEKGLIEYIDYNIEEMINRAEKLNIMEREK